MERLQSSQEIMGWAGEGVGVVGEGLLANQEHRAKWGWVDNLIIHFQGTTEVPALLQTMACGF